MLELTANGQVMRVFALSDIHVDYVANKEWIVNISASDYRDDILILAGDVCHSISLLSWSLNTLAARFARVLYVPGNHDLWVFQDNSSATSLDKFHKIRHVVEDCGVSMQAFHCNRLSIVPLLGWYDYSFGEPTQELLEGWMDYRACRWPADLSPGDITEYFLLLNDGLLNITNETVISFSHFLPRIDLMPSYIPENRRMIYPVLGSSSLEAQIRRLKPEMHIYGHSHFNRNVTFDHVRYVNNAFGYPQEVSIAAKRLMCVYEC
jgi:predicted phosphodiesterase